MTSREILVAKLREGVEAWNWWRAENWGIGIDLRGVNLEHADLAGANLERANLTDANLKGANLARVSLRGADLLRAGLADANLKGANLERAKLELANLACASLADANLTDANLTRANLERANLERVQAKNARLVETKLELATGTHAYLVAAILEHANLKDAKFEHADLTRANLMDADLARVNLIDANLKHANLARATLERATLERAHFERATLVCADLQESELGGANLSHANLEDANLQGANLGGANLERVYLGRAHLEHATLFNTKILDVGLSDCRGLSTIRQIGPSHISTSTLERTAQVLMRNPSNQGDVEAFLRGAGLSESAMDYFRSLISSPFEFYSCFISYSHVDSSFARRIYDHLQGRGIRCWLDEHQLKPGDDIYHGVDRGIRLWDKVLFCASKGSLNSWWVERELDTAFEKERKLRQARGEATLAIIPLNLDGYLFEWRHSHASAVRKRLAADFTGWESDNAKFETQLERVAEALRADSGAREKAPGSRL